MKATFLPKTCTWCQKDWMPRTREQAARNLYCSKVCANKALSAMKLGHPRGLTAPRVVIPCKTCGKPVTKRQAQLVKTRETFCSYRCAGKERAKNLVNYSGNMKGRKRSYSLNGESNPAWKGGVTHFRKHGNYKPIKYIRCPADLLAMARKDGYVMEHRVIMARLARRPLTRTEVVHHENHNPQDNTPTNLELWPDNRTHKLAESGHCVIGAACRLSPMD